MKNPHHPDSENWWLLVVSSDGDTCDQWQTTHFTLSLMTSLLLLLALPTGRPCQCIASKTLFHKHSTQTIKKACHKSGFMMDLNTDHCGRSWKPYRIATDMLLGVGYYLYFLNSIDNTISNEPSDSILQPFTPKLWQRYTNMTSGNFSSN